MADAMSLAKAPTEKMGDFNKRLREACSNEENPVTEVQIIVVDGEPLVTLFSEFREVTDEDIEEATEAEDDEIPKLGELIPDGDPLVVQVVKVSCNTDEQAAKTQQRLEKLYSRADGGVIGILNATGARLALAPAPKDSKEQLLVQEQVSYVLVSYLAGQDGDEDDKGGDAAMEAGVRTPVGAKS